MTRFRLLFAAVLAALLVVPAAAVAHPLIGKTLKKAIWGPVEVDGVSQFPTYKAMDADIFQIQIRWERVAPQRPADPSNPDDPAYRWPDNVDQAVEEAAEHGIKVLILIQGTPEWANGGGRFYTPPDNPADYGAFVQAAARRYSSVRHWMIWGEPSRNIAWPGFDRSDPGRVRIAQAYAGLLDAAYVALKGASRKNIVIGGNSFTTAPQPESWAPVPLYEFMRLMRLPNGKPPRMDMWGHNPFTARIPRLKDGPGDNQGDFSDVDRLIKQLKRKVARPLKKKIPVFISEWCVPTGESSLPRSVSLEEQAVWLKRAFKIARKHRMIYGMGWWDLKDSSTNTCGLLDADARPKPAFRIFQRARTLR